MPLGDVEAGVVACNLVGGPTVKDAAARGMKDVCRGWGAKDLEWGGANGKE